jgi:hypothetical protein
MTKKIFIGFVAALLLLGGWFQATSVAEAQSLSCVLLTRDFGVGDSGPDVSFLQEKLGLVVTGYFGAITQQAVIVFQESHGIPATGYVNPMTRAAFNALYSCPNPVPLPTITSFISTPSDLYGGSIKFTWTSTGASQVQLTAMLIGGVNVTNAETGECICSSQALPSEGSYYVKFLNGEAHPKEIVFFLDPLPMNFSDIESYRKTITIVVPASEISPVITSMSHTKGPIGTVVTIKGKNFSKNGNSLSFGWMGSVKGYYGYRIWNLDSVNGNTLQFTIPKTLLFTSEAFLGSKEVATLPGEYQIGISNNDGNSDEFKFTVVSKEEKIKLIK